RAALPDADSALDHRARGGVPAHDAAVPDHRSRRLHPDHPDLPGLRLLGLPRQGNRQAGGNDRMNPLTRLFRRSRAFRLLFYVSIAPLWALIIFISFDSFGAYSEVGDVTLLLLIMLFALWSWWYGE